MKESPIFRNVTTALGAALVLLAFLVAVRTTTGLDWPCEIDFFRDMGGAQAILDGYAGADPAYSDEANWFNPLQPALFAALTSLTGLPLSVLYAQFGPVVNLLGPLAFWLLASQLMGRGAALAALSGYLFLSNPNVPSWFQATYSPWAWPMDFAQGLIFLTAAAYAHALRSRRVRWDIITGILLGLTFLAHTAPTLVFVGMLALLTVFAPHGERRRAALRLVIVGMVSLVVAAPFLGPLLVKYHLHVMNRGPSEYEPIGGSFALWNLFSFRSAIAALGLAALARLRSTDARNTEPTTRGEQSGTQPRVLVALLVSSTLLFTYGILAQGLQHRDLAYLPRVLPTYHFHLYMKAAESLLFGVGLAALAHYILRRWPSSRATGWIMPGLVMLVVAAFLPRYLRGIELNEFRHDAERISAETDRIALYRWILDETSPSDVFLTDVHRGMWTVAPADRKVVCLGDQYSNIYVDHVERARDLDGLFASLRARDQSTFDALAEKYRVTHVLLAKAAPPAHQVPSECLSADRFALVYAVDACQVYRLK